MTILDWPREERPRERLLSKGAAALSDAELLAIFLRTGIVGKTAVDLARDLLSRYGNLRNLFLAEKTEFCNTQGIGMAKYAQIQAILEIGRRHLQETLPSTVSVADAADLKQYLNSRLRDYAHEVFGCLFLDKHQRVIVFEELFQGTLDSTCVYPREVMKRALKHNAAAVILTHNHPSGIAAPSEADKDITRVLKTALAWIGIKVLDHFIIGDTAIVSFVERGLL